jgi:hypothetical protein
VEGVVGLVRRALVAKRELSALAETLAQLRQDARFADSGFAGQQDDLAIAFAGKTPAVEQQGDLVLAASWLLRAPRRTC